MIKECRTDFLNLQVHDTRTSMGETAARAVAAKIREILAERDEVNMVFASAPSQDEFLQALRQDGTIPWNRIHAFHMDEYIGLPADAPQGFGNFIRARLWGHVPLKSANYLDGSGRDVEGECRRYADLLRTHPIDIVCFGIGENGHLAFNDPPVADFADPKAVKRVELEEACRLQQVHDGCFAALDQVPRSAITLTIPALVSGRFLYGMVPGRTKAVAVRRTMTDPVWTACPSTILRGHRDARLYVDRESASLL